MRDDGVGPGPACAFCRRQGKYICAGVKSVTNIYGARFCRKRICERCKTRKEAGYRERRHNERGPAVAYAVDVCPECA